MTEIFDLIDNFRVENPDAFIGIHCTHGFNRTGFIICSYMVERCNWYVGDAIAAFAAARNDGIYRENVIVELYRRYDPDYLDTPIDLSIPTPSWHNGRE